MKLNPIALSLIITISWIIILFVCLLCILDESQTIGAVLVPIYSAPTIGLISFLTCVFVQFKWAKNHLLVVCIWILIWGALTVYTASGTPNGPMLLYEALTLQLEI